MSWSVIIPTLNEAATIAATVRAIRRQQPREIVVVDGGSSDATVLQAGEADLVVTSARGRATQMNAGAAVARGDLFLFLHADCNLEEGALSTAAECLRRRGVTAGCFRMRVQAAATIYRLIDFCATARVRLTGLVYGDQGLFVRRDVFTEVGGFPVVRLMEDVLISQALQRRGRIVVAGKGIFVSPRRWLRQGVVRQTLRNWALTALAAAGAPPDRLARFYPPIRG